MEFEERRRPAPSSAPGSTLLARLELHRDPDGVVWAVVSDASEAIRQSELEASRPTTHGRPRRPMEVVEEWLREGAERFTRAWRQTR